MSIFDRALQRVRGRRDDVLTLPIEAARQTVGQLTDTSGTGGLLIPPTVVAGKSTKFAISETDALDLSLIHI